MSGMEKKSKIPNAPLPVPLPGNLLSNVAPPTQLPNFITASSSTLPVDVQNAPQSTAQVQDKSAPAMEVEETFSPFIPLEKVAPLPSSHVQEDNKDNCESTPISEPDLVLGDIMPGSGILTWMKGAMSSGGILHKVAERAKSSVDTMITTLDPQMKEYLKSGGDILVVVASDKDVKISPVREAFQTVFGKATVIGCPAQSDVTAAQPVGYAAAYAAAKQRIAHVRSNSSEVNNNVLVVAVENFLHEAIADRWYDIALLVLSQPSLGVELQVQSQGTPIPSPAVAAAREATPEDYAHKQTGFAVTIGSIMADNLKVHHTQWQEASTGVPRREMLLLAARSLAGSYKKILEISATEP